MTLPEVSPQSASGLAVPLGEFDSPSALMESERRRLAFEQSTVKRAAPEVGFGNDSSLPPPPPPPPLLPPLPPPPPPSASQLLQSSSPSWSGSSSMSVASQSYERGDPTQGPDATSIAPPPIPNTHGKLRKGAQFRRKRGLFGDVRYVATAAFGVRRARKELADLEDKQTQREISRRRYLITLGRTAVSASGFDHPALGEAREQLVAVEDERSKHTGQVTAADSELMRVRRDRDEKAAEHAAEITRLDGELAAIAKKLEPLEKQSIQVSKRAEELRESMAKIENRITQTEANMILARTNPKFDRAALQAELVSLKADRQSVQKDEPILAGELDGLQPRIAALEAARNEARKKRAQIVEAESEDQKRTEELLTAIGAKRKVMDRAAADAEALRDKVLFELGELLYVDRPANMIFELAPIDAIDMELGTGERRMMELREIISSVDKMKLARGIALLILFTSAIGMLVYWSLYLFG